MSPKQKPSLPANRGFVIQMHGDAQPERGQWSGRVEHLLSAQVTHFQSLEELLNFIVQVLAEQRVDED